MTLVPFAVILDADGVIFDSEKISLAAFMETVADFGQDLEFGAFDNEDGDVRITRSDADDAPAEAEADAEAPAEEAEAASEDD